METNKKFWLQSDKKFRLLSKIYDKLSLSTLLDTRFRCENLTYITVSPIEKLFYVVGESINSPQL